MRVVDQAVGVLVLAEVEQLLQQGVAVLELDQIQLQHLAQQTQVVEAVLVVIMEALAAMEALAVQV